MKGSLSLCIFLCFGLLAGAQTADFPSPTPADERIASLQKREKLADNPMVDRIPFRSIGPSVFSGRVDDVAVSPSDPSHFYVAYASGGLWKTENNGASFTPLFDAEMTISIGAIAVDWQNNTIWVGTGEVNSSRSSYSGVGIYKSRDGGKTWEYLGLPESHHIGRIVLHPTDPQTAWLAVMGHLYSPNEERGIYKTSDGGQTWRKSLYVNPNTGASDLVINPANPDELYAATWSRERRAWNFVESGTGSGIHRSIDGGESWQLITDGNNEFPTGTGTGRIGLALHQQGAQTTLYASVDNYNRRPPEKPAEENTLTRQDLREMNREDFLKLRKYQLEDYLRGNRFPRDVNAEKVIKMVRKKQMLPSDLVKYTERPTDEVYETAVVGLEVYRSNDRGKSWSKTHEDYLDGVYSSFGYYFGQIRVSPHNPDKVYCLGVPVLRSDDGGRTFQSINGDNVHVDHHALWINPSRAGHLILGNDGGINISYDDGENWIKCNTPPLGQYYYIAVDNEEPYNIYGGLQDNGMWYGPHDYEASTRWHGSGDYPYKRISGGDGMQVAIDTRDNNIIYGGTQFGYYFRYNKSTGRRKRITPRHDLGESPWRWNWQTPIHLSTHNQDILYMGSQQVHRSMNRGDDFEIISGDLTLGGKKGDVPYGTLTTIHESPLRFGLLYTGSDDGQVYVSKSGGHSWEQINRGLPEKRWVSRIVASSHRESRVYLTLNGYRWDNFEALLYQSEDYGKTWQRIGQDLPAEPLNVVKEDPVNPDLLYVGSDHGLYVSLDRGESFTLMNNGLPAVPVHDLVVHPGTNDLIVGTHGRSLYLGNVGELQQLTREIRTKDLHVFDTKPPRYNSNWGNSWSPWREAPVPEMKIPVYSKNSSAATLTVKSSDDLVLNTVTVEAFSGLYYLPYDLTVSEEAKEAYQAELNRASKANEKPILVKQADNGKIYLRKGQYTLEIEKNGEKAIVEIELK